MKGVITSIRKTMSNIDFKSKKIWLFIGLFVVAITLSSAYLSHSYYIKTSDNTLAIGGTAFVSSADINLKIYLEDRNASENGSGTYSREYFIPTANYKYNSSKTACTKGIIIKDFSNGQFNIEAENKGWCKVYFDAVDGVISDSSFNLYVEQTKGQGDYKQEGRLPDDLNTYVIDTSRTSCTGQGAASASLSITNREIYLTTNGDVTCEIYAKISSTNSSYANLATTIIKLNGNSDLVSSQNSELYWYKVESANGYRYKGKDPDNYVSFNGELWRIIGAFDGADIGMKSGSYYPKLIRSYLTDSSAYTTSSSDYVNSNLNKYLNGEYYESMNSVAKNMIISATLHLGAHGSIAWGDSPQSSYYYNWERGSTLGYSASTLKTQSKVALMYSSDYLYAPYNDLYLNWSDDNWLFYSSDEVLLGVNDYSSHPIIVTDGNHGVASAVANEAKYFRPTVYLDSTTVIIGGNGSKTNPYRIK